MAAGGGPEAFSLRAHVAALCPGLDDHVLHAAGEKGVPDPFRVLLPGQECRLLIVRKYIVKEGEAFPHIPDGLPLLSLCHVRADREPRGPGPGEKAGQLPVSEVGGDEDAGKAEDVTALQCVFRHIFRVEFPQRAVRAGDEAALPLVVYQDNVDACGDFRIPADIAGVDVKVPAG